MNWLHRRGSCRSRPAILVVWGRRVVIGGIVMLGGMIDAADPSSTSGGRGPTLGASVTTDDLRATSAVGVASLVEDVVLPGPQRQVIGLDDPAAPLVVRIVSTHPHGSGFRYDLQWYALVPGDYDLTTVLRPVRSGSSKEDSPADVVPAVLVRAVNVLPPDVMTPGSLTTVAPSVWSGYRTIILVGGILWFIGLAALALTRRPRRSVPTKTVPVVTLADRLRPLAEKAMAGTMTTTERATLERSLLSYWQRRLNVERLPPGEALAAIRRDPTAGPLLETLEQWLHRPHPAVDQDLTAWLEPYTHVAANEVLELPPNEPDRRMVKRY